VVGLPSPEDTFVDFPEPPRLRSRNATTNTMTAAPAMARRGLTAPRSPAVLRAQPTAEG
jgi:hypothetical protein